MGHARGPGGSPLNPLFFFFSLVHPTRGAHAGGQGHRRPLLGPTRPSVTGLEPATVAAFLSLSLSFSLFLFHSPESPAILLLCRWHDRSPPADQTVTGRSPGAGGGRRPPSRLGEATGTSPALDQCGSAPAQEKGRLGLLLLSPTPGPLPDTRPMPMGVAGHLLGPARRQARHRAWTNGEGRLGEEGHCFLSLSLRGLALSLAGRTGTVQLGRAVPCRAGEPDFSSPAWHGYSTIPCQARPDSYRAVPAHKQHARCLSLDKYNKKRLHQTKQAMSFMIFSSTSL